MALSKEFELELRKKLELSKDVGKVVADVFGARDFMDRVDINIEVLKYLSSENLVKQSKALTWLTWGLIALGIGMLVLAGTQLYLFWPNRMIV